MRFKQELHIQAPIEFVYDCLLDFGRLHEEEFVGFYYNRLDDGGKVVGLLQDGSRYYRGEITYTERPHMYVAQSTISSVSTSTIFTRLSAELQAVEHETNLRLIHHISYFSWIEKMRARPSEQEMMEQVKERWVAYKEKIEEAYQQNPVFEPLTNPECKVAEEEIKTRWDEVKQKRSLSQYVVLVAVLSTICFDIFDDKDRFHHLIHDVPVVIGAIGFFLSGASKPSDKIWWVLFALLFLGSIGTDLAKYLHLT